MEKKAKMIRKGAPAAEAFRPGRNAQVASELSPHIKMIRSLHSREYDTENHAEKSNYTEKPLKSH